MTETLSSFIGVAKPKATLLTTYTLSLSYFEATVLSMLKQRGCKDIVLLVDEQEALNSVTESRSMGAGRSYRLLPVASPGGGFFHPKIAYLECEDDDFLIVGSGNLTFSGQGGNLECIDALRSSEHPKVFDEFAQWCITVSNAIKQSHPQAAVQLEAFSYRAASRAQKFANTRPRTAWLVHTAAESAFDQVVRIARNIGNWSTLRVLSPFHPPNGSTSIELTKALAITSLEIGVNPLTGEVPLDDRQFSPHVPVRYVQPCTSEENARELHAKWFELLNENCALIMTGSVNATAQSMKSTKNVEISLARLLDKSPVEWETIIPTSFTPSKFMPLDQAEIRFSLEACQLSDSRINLQLHKLVPPQLVTVTLQCAGKTINTWKNLNLSNDGKLITPLCDTSRVLFAITVTVTGVGFQATGWLNMEPILNGSELSIDNQEALNRIAEGKGLPGDSLVFLQMIAQFVSVPNKVSISMSRPAGTKDSVSNQDNKEFSYRDWINSGRQGYRNELGISTVHFIKSLAEIFNLNPENPDNEQPIQMLLGNFETDEENYLPSGWGNSQRGSLSRNNKELEASQKKELAELIPAVLKRHADQPYAHLLAQYLLAEAFSHSRSKTSILSAEQALSPCWKWLHLCGELQFNEATRKTLFAIAIAITAWMAHIYKEAGQTIPSEQLRAHLFKLREEGPFELAEANELIVLALANPILNGLHNTIKGDMIAMLPILIEAGSLDEKLVCLVNQILSDVTFSPDERTNILFPGIAAKIRENRNSSKRFGIYKEIADRDPSCPCCYVRFNKDIVRTLKQNHAVVCPEITCKKVVLDIRDHQLIEKLPRSTNIA